MEVGILWLFVVFSAEAHHSLVCDKCDRLGLWVGPDLRHHHVDAKVEFLPVK